MSIKLTTRFKSVEDIFINCRGRQVIDKQAHEAVPILQDALNFGLLRFDHGLNKEPEDFLDSCLYYANFYIYLIEDLYCGLIDYDDITKEFREVRYHSEIKKRMKKLTKKNF